MAIDSHYIPAFSIEDVLLDKDTGAPLTGGLVYFEQDNQRGVLKPVYQITGTSPNYTYTQLSNPMTLSSIGTFEDSLGNPVVPYFYPYDANLNVEYYYVRVTSSEDVPQFDREAVPYVAGSGDFIIANSLTNEITNPQFSEVLFDTVSSNYVYSFNAVLNEVVNLAPGWDLVVSSVGAGTVTVSQITPAGTLNIITNPGTILNIQSSGITSLKLRQRFYGSPNLWGDGFLSASFVAKTYSGSAVTLNLYYSQSNGTVIDEQLVSASLASSGAYSAYSGTTFIPASDSSQFFPDSYVDIFFDLPLSVEIDITSVMVAFTGDTSVADITYEQNSQDDQINDLFYYYKPQLEFKPIPSLLTAWDFPLNPTQFGLSPTITTSADYAWDQTICKSVVGNIAVTRGFSGGFQATTANNNEAFYMLQYLANAEAKAILGNKLSVNINAFRSQTGGAVDVQVYLYCGRNAASIPMLASTIGTLAADGDFTLTQANWTLIPRGNLGQAQGSLSTVSTADYTQLNDVVDLKFSGWELESSAQIADTDKFAIVVTFSCPTTGTVVTVDSISLVKGDIPTRPAAQSKDEVLRQCQYYYEKSYDNEVVPTTATNIGQVLAAQNFVFSGPSISLIAMQFNLQFNTVKRAIPGSSNLGMYSPVTGAATKVRGFAYANGVLASSGDIDLTAWTVFAYGTKNISFITTNTTSFITSGATVNVAASAFIGFQYVINCMYGILA